MNPSRKYYRSLWREKIDICFEDKPGWSLLYVKTNSTLSLLNDDVIILFLTLADWSTRNRLKVKVSSKFLRMEFIAEL